MLKHCLIEDCGNKVFSRGWCSGHWKRWRKTGKTDLAGRTENGEPLRFLIEVAFPFRSLACLTWPYYKSDFGYGNINVDGQPRKVHRILCEMAHGPPPSDKHQAAHVCGNGHLACLNPLHVMWKTSVENMADKLFHGTDNRGEKHPLSKLTEDQVLVIRELCEYRTYADVAKQFSVHPHTVNLIHKRINWGWLEDGSSGRRYSESDLFGLP